MREINEDMPLYPFDIFVLKLLFVIILKINSIVMLNRKLKVHIYVFVFIYT